MSSIEQPTSSEIIGAFNNITYIRHRGQFKGATEGGDFSVPYEITVPKIPTEGKQVFVFEPPHLTSGLIARNSLLGEDFFFSHGYSHASCGFANRAGHILNPTPGFELRIKGQKITVLPPGSPEAEVIDTNIIRQFAFVLRRGDSPLFGAISRIYAVGFSDSGKTIQNIYKFFGHTVFDLTLAGSAPYFEPVKIRGQHPIMVLNTEADFDARAIPNPDFPDYRYYHIAGGPHIPDSVLTRRVFAGQPPFPAIAGTTPINWLLFARGLFASGDQSLTRGKPLPANATFRLDARGEILRDDRQNARGGIRHPAVELREARFIASVDRGGWELFGDYKNPRMITEAEYPEYSRLFKQATDKLFDAGYLLPAGRERLHREAQLSPPNTYTLNYRDGRLLR